ncbi:MAG: indolepyruvate oxidoreductase subunit beta [Anaerolineae bacterium]
MGDFEKNDTYSVDLKLVLAGVGGQGVLFATRLLSETAQALGMDFISSEIHGMSQRGGSVVSHLKIGPYESPLVCRGSADALLAFTLDEGYRNLSFLRPGGDWVVTCPELEALDGRIRAYLAERGVRLHSLDADGLAQESPRVANVALVGFATGRGVLPLPATSLKVTLETISPERFRALNLEAFQRGIEAGGARKQ